MLVRMLLLALAWLVLSSAVLLAVGRRLGGPSAVGSLALVMGIETCGGLAALALGMPRLELLGAFVLSTGVGLLVIWAFPDWNAAGHAAWLFAAEAAGGYLAVAAVFALLVPVGIVGRMLGLVLLVMQLAALLLTLSYLHELLDVVCRRRWRRPEGRPPRIAARGRARARAAEAERDQTDRRPWWTPRVALHVPCHDEPPELVERTLRALARLDYPRASYTVLVVDNNTGDPALWRPVARLCEQLDYLFLHLEQWPGYKSGALNYALAATPLEYELIGVVDADYLVEPTYLRDLVAHFADPAVAFVQTPQDYRDYGPDSTFYQRACYQAYRYFFDLSMPSRNERNAIIFGGTMGLLRADAVRAIGGWDEGCITEDAEASLRLLARGYRGVFVNRSYGRGLMPLDFDALKRQRFRWCFGGIQILRKHWPALLPWARRARPAAGWEVPGLTLAQRYHYLLGGLQWYGDVLAFGFTALLLVSGWLLLLGRPVRLPVLGGPLLLLPLTFWLTSLLRTWWGLRATRRCSWGEALGAVGILWSLGWVVTLACLQGLFRRRGVFLRTPKAGRASLARALRSTTVETTLGGACWVMALLLLAPQLAQVRQALSSTSLAGGLRAVHGAPWWLLGTSATGLGLLAVLQGLTYLTAPVLCLLSLRSEAAAREVRRRALGADAGEGTLERRLLAGAVAVVAALALLLVGATALAPPEATPIGQGRQQTLSTLLGNANPLSTPTPVSSALPAGTATALPGGGATPTAGASPTPTGPSAATATATPRRGATPTPQRTVVPTQTPPRATPTPHH